MLFRSNELRERAGLDLLSAGDFDTEEAFIAQILEERRKELAFEGQIGRASCRERV